MDDTQVLHNAARHYCIERSTHWHGQYAELVSAGRERTAFSSEIRDYTDEAYAIFPRYNILAAIRSDIERFVPEDFDSANQLRELLTVAAETAQNAFTECKSPVGKHAIEDERRRFAEFIRCADERQLASLPPLPFRRVLGEAEHRDLQATFARQWGRWSGGSVDPSHAAERCVTLHTAAMEPPNAYDNLRRLLKDHGVHRLLELREYGDGFELDACDACFTYDGAEGYWKSAIDSNWMVYASHESSITFGGPWLIEGMRACLPLFDRYLYRGWDLAAYETNRPD